jgi:hypothetical protein
VDQSYKMYVNGYWTSVSTVKEIVWTYNQSNRPLIWLIYKRITFAVKSVNWMIQLKKSGWKYSLWYEFSYPRIYLYKNCPNGLQFKEDFSITRIYLALWFKQNYELAPCKIWNIKLKITWYVKCTYVVSNAFVMSRSLVDSCQWILKTLYFSPNIFSLSSHISNLISLKRNFPQTHREDLSNHLLCY